MIIRSRAPLRLGLAGGGTDTSPYSDTYGGAILNITVNLFSYATIIPRNDGKVVFRAIDRNEFYECQSGGVIEIDSLLPLHKGIYNRIIKDFTENDLSFELTTYSDAPPGSGLGTSSTMVVSILGAFVEWLKLPFGEYDIAKLAFEIERKDLKMSGGKQDQYAATFGGMNFMEFNENDKVVVNPLRIRKEILNELECNLLLYYTNTSRDSAKIIDSQTKNVREKEKKSIEAMHNLKKQAYMMKEAVLRGDLNVIGEILDFGWKSKKNLSSKVSNPLIDEIYQTAITNGATGGKISGAGGGGFMTLYCPTNSRFDVIKSLEKFNGKFERINFTEQGLISWESNN